MEKIKAVLIDTVSIQKYVFASNELKTNSGASYLVENIFKGFLQKALNNLLDDTVDLDLWKNNPDQIRLLEFSGEKFEVGYIGGGNALIFFRGIESKDFIKNWTKLLLIQAPGLQTAFAVDEFTLEDIENSINFNNKINNLYKQLADNKNLYHVNANLHKYGFTAECPKSGLSAEIYYKNEECYISSEIHAKVNAAQKHEKYLGKLFKEELGDLYCFTNRIDELGQSDSKSYVSIVHIDGNSMSERFKGVKSLAEKRKMSISVENATKKSFKELVSYTTKLVNKLVEDESKLFKFKFNEEGKTILPLRPIVLSADDITFVSEGRLGFHLTHVLLDLLSQKKLVDGLPLFACGGVSIIKTKYPFYRGYELSSQLCSSAKMKAREYGNRPWIDYYISQRGISGPLEQIRELHYNTESGFMNFSPYLLPISDEDHKNVKNINFILKAIQDIKRNPRSKIKEFQSIIRMRKDSRRNNLQRLKERGFEIPIIEGGSYHVDGWQDSCTPYNDIIELIEFYPQECIEFYGFYKEKAKEGC